MIGTRSRQPRRLAALAASLDQALRMVALLASIAVVMLLAGSTPVTRGGSVSAAPDSTSNPVGQFSATLPRFDHIFVVIMENRSFADILESGEAPYVSSLAGANGLATQYFPVTRGSLANYLALTGGDTFEHTGLCPYAGCPVHFPNFVDRLEAAGKTWRAYMESMPRACATSSSGSYAVDHNPFVYFDDVRYNLSRCEKHVVSLQPLSADLRSAASLPNFVWITPNLCHDMHNCDIATGDRWLANFLPSIFGSPAFTRQNSLLVLTWDEGNFTHRNQVATILVAPRHIRPGTRSAVRYNNYSLLRTIEVAWKLAPLTSNDARATPMADLFNSP